MGDERARRVHDALWSLVQNFVEDEDKSISEKRCEEALGSAKSIIKR